MAQHHYNTTGVLMLKQVTPVIRALFGTLHLTETQAGNGEVYFAILDNGTNGVEPCEPRWDDIHQQLLTLMRSLDCPISNDAEGYAAECLTILASHFHVTDSDRDELIVDSYLDTHVYLHTLFRMAICFDDGHHLKAIKYEGAKHSSEAEPFQFNGHGGFLSRHIEFETHSSHEVELGQALHQAIEKRKVDDAAEALNLKIKTILAAVCNRTQRAAVRRQLVAKLLGRRYPAWKRNL